MTVLQILERTMFCIFLVLLCIWCIQKVEYSLRPEGMKKSSYSVDTLIGV